MELILSGQCPSKKNMYRRSKNGGMFLNREVVAQIDALILQARAQWGRGPIAHPDLEFTFYVKDRRGDRDNKLGTCMDVLQKAGVLLNDNIASSNGRLVILPAVVDKSERVVIRIQEAA